jgi:hypothetical protein
MVHEYDTTLASPTLGRYVHYDRLGAFVRKQAIVQSRLQAAEQWAKLTLLLLGIIAAGIVILVVKT